MIRAGVALALAGLFLVSSWAVSPAVAQSGAVTWTVNHQAKTITVDVKLEIYGKDATSSLATAIKTEIERVWKDLKYRCYDLRFAVDVKVGTDESAVDADRVGVRIESTPVDFRSYVGPRSLVERIGQLLRRRGSLVRSEQPGDRVHPHTGPGSGSAWAATPYRANTYAHEFGHVLGLDDGYRDETGPDGRPRGVHIDGAPADLMSIFDGLSRETIDRLVRRNRDNHRDGAGNPVDLSDLRCDLLLEVEITMTGHRPPRSDRERAFQAKIVAKGTIELKEIGRPAGTQGGAPVTHEGRGNLAYDVSPLGRTACTFGYEGSGGFPIGARASLPDLPEGAAGRARWASSIVITLAPKLDRLPRDTLIAWPCGGGKTLRTRVVPLLTAWYTDRLGAEWRIVDWTPYANPGAGRLAAGEFRGSCALNLCVERDTFELLTAP